MTPKTVKLSDGTEVLRDALVKAVVSKLLDGSLRVVCQTVPTAERNVARPCSGGCGATVYIATKVEDKIKQLFEDSPPLSYFCQPCAQPYSTFPA